VGFFLDKSISISLSIRLSKRILTVVSQKTVPSCSSKSASKFRHLPEPATHRPHLDAQATAVYPGKTTNCLPLRPLLPRPDRCRRRRRATLPRARRRACPSSIWPPPCPLSPNPSAGDAPPGVDRHRVAAGRAQIIWGHGRASAQGGLHWGSDAAVVPAGLGRPRMFSGNLLFDRCRRPAIYF
jgi:hypothetical protein